MDDTASQWSAAADSEEERKSALEKSMYVILQFRSFPVFALRMNYGDMDASTDVLPSIKDSIVVR